MCAQPQATAHTVVSDKVWCVPVGIEPLRSLYVVLYHGVAIKYIQ